MACHPRKRRLEAQQPMVPAVAFLGDRTWLTLPHQSSCQLKVWCLPEGKRKQAAMSHTAGLRTSRSAAEPRMSYEDLKDMMAMAAEKMNEEARERKKAAQAQQNLAVILTESKAQHNNSERNGSSEISKRDWKSNSYRESRSMEAMAEKLTTQGGANTSLAWTSKAEIGSISEKLQKMHPDISKENSNMTENSMENRIETEKETSSALESSECLSTSKTPQSCLTKRPSSVINASHGYEKETNGDNISNTGVWPNGTSSSPDADHAVFSQDEVTDTEGWKGSKPQSPEIKEEDMQPFETSAMIEDQLPGRLSQSVRYIKPGHTMLSLSNKGEKKSPSSIRALSSKVASKLVRLFSSKTGRKGSSSSSPPSEQDSTGPAGELTRSPTKAETVFQRWLQKKLRYGDAERKKPIQSYVEADQPQKNFKLARADLDQNAFGSMRMEKENVQQVCHESESESESFGKGVHSRSTLIKSPKPERVAAYLLRFPDVSTSLSQGVGKVEPRSLYGRAFPLPERDNGFSAGASDTRISPQDYLLSALVLERGLGLSVPRMKPLKIRKILRQSQSPLTADEIQNLTGDPISDVKGSPKPVLDLGCGFVGTDSEICGTLGRDPMELPPTSGTSNSFRGSVAVASDKFVTQHHSQLPDLENSESNSSDYYHEEHFSSEEKDSNPREHHFRPGDLSHYQVLNSKCTFESNLLDTEKKYGREQYDSSEWPRLPSVLVEGENNTLFNLSAQRTRKTGTDFNQYADDNAVLLNLADYDASSSQGKLSVSRSPERGTPDFLDIGKVQTDESAYSLKETHYRGNQGNPFLDFRASQIFREEIFINLAAKESQGSSHGHSNGSGVPTAGAVDEPPWIATFPPAEITGEWQLSGSAALSFCLPTYRRQSSSEQLEDLKRYLTDQAMRRD